MKKAKKIKRLAKKLEAMGLDKLGELTEADIAGSPDLVPVKVHEGARCRGKIQRPR
jgi:hypothetical protein